MGFVGFLLLIVAQSAVANDQLGQFVSDSKSVIYELKISVNQVQQFLPEGFGISEDSVTDDDKISILAIDKKSENFRRANEVSVLGFRVRSLILVLPPLKREIDGKEIRLGIRGMNGLGASYLKALGLINQPELIQSIIDQSVRVEQAQQVPSKIVYPGKNNWICEQTELTDEGSEISDFSFGMKNCL